MVVTLVSISYIFKAFIGKRGLTVKRLFKAAKAEVTDNS